LFYDSVKRLYDVVVTSSAGRSGQSGGPRRARKPGTEHLIMTGGEHLPSAPPPGGGQERSGLGALWLHRQAAV
jgi:hypothetical protein